MREIKEVVRRIKHEMKSAEWYADEAVKDKEMYPALSRHYHSMAVDNMNRMDELHKAAVEMIEEIKHSDKQIPQGMLDAWEWEHQMLLEDAADIKTKINMHN